MGMCPVCNGLKELRVSCSICHSEMENRGMVMDYEDEYSAYEEIDTLKMNDGFPETFKKGECPHLMFCLKCNHDEVVLITERNV